MELHYSVDEAARRLHAVVVGEFSGDVFINLLNRMRAEGTWTFDMLLDIRRVSGVPMLQDLRNIAFVATRPGPEGQLRGPLAILASEGALYGAACAYAAISRGRAIGVFRDRPAA